MVDNVFTLHKTEEPADNIVLMLRQMADEIERGDKGVCNSAAFILDTDDSLEVYGWGTEIKSTNDMVAMLAVAQQSLIDAVYLV